MAEEKLFTINLRKETIKKARYKRAKKAVTAIREYIKKHMKTNDVKIGKHLNELLLSKGRKNPPGKIKVKSIIEETYARVELPEFEFEKKKEEKKTSLKEKILGKKEEKPKEPKLEEIREEQKLVKEGKLEEKQETHKLQEKHPAEHKGEIRKEEQKLAKTKKLITKTEKPHHEKKK